MTPDRVARVLIVATVGVLVVPCIAFLVGP